MDNHSTERAAISSETRERVEQLSAEELAQWMVHVRKCLRNSLFAASSGCGSDICELVKSTAQHMRTCTANTPCADHLCVRMKKVLAHVKTCTSSTCDNQQWCTTLKTAWGSSDGRMKTAEFNTVTTLQQPPSFANTQPQPFEFGSGANALPQPFEFGSASNRGQSSTMRGTPVHNNSLPNLPSAMTSDVPIDLTVTFMNGGPLTPQAANPVGQNAPADLRVTFNKDGPSSSRAAIGQQLPVNAALVETSELERSMNQSQQQNLELRQPRCNVLVSRPICFHRLVGRNVTLDISSMQASRSPNSRYNGYVMTARPLVLGESIRLRVTATQPRCGAKGSLTFGVTSCDPATINVADWPDDGFDLMDRSEYWIVQPDVCVSPAVNDELVFQLKPDGEVLFASNNLPAVPLMFVDTSVKLWAFWDMRGALTQLTLIDSFVGERRDERGRQSTTASLPVPASMSDAATSLAYPNDQPLINQPNIRTNVVRPFIGADVVSSNHEERKLLRAHRRLSTATSDLNSATAPLAGDYEQRPEPQAATNDNPVGSRSRRILRAGRRNRIEMRNHDYPNVSATADAQVVPLPQGQAYAAAFSSSLSANNLSLQPFQFSAAATQPISPVQTYVRAVFPGGPAEHGYQSRTSIGDVQSPVITSGSAGSSSPFAFGWPAPLPAANPVRPFGALPDYLLQSPSFGSLSAGVQGFNGGPNDQFAHSLQRQVVAPVSASAPSTRMNTNPVIPLDSRAVTSDNTFLDLTGFTCEGPALRPYFFSTSGFSVNSVTTPSSTGGSSVSSPPTRLSATSMQPSHSTASASSAMSPACSNEGASSGRDRDECVVCMDRPSDCALYSCGHMCMCFTCAQRIRKSSSPLCPICKKSIFDVLRIFRS